MEAVPEKKRKPEIPSESCFAKTMNFYTLFWVFFIGAVLGVIVETAWCWLNRGYYESRVGLVYGPFNLVYGFGALVMTLGLHWAENKKWPFIFIGGIFLGTGFEYFCGWLQEALFGAASWQYTAAGNINGRISLKYSIFWGLLALLWVRWLCPLMQRGMSRFPEKVIRPLTWVLLVFMIFNTVMSALAVARMSERRREIPASSGLQTFFDEHFDDARMKRIYPGMVFLDEKE